MSRPTGWDLVRKLGCGCEVVATPAGKELLDVCTTHVGHVRIAVVPEDKATRPAGVRGKQA